MHKNNNSSEDIDLYKLILIIKNKTYKWRLLLIIAPILGIITGGSVYLFSPKEYLSRMTVASNLLSGPNFVVTVENLQLLVKEGNIPMLAKLLNIDNSAASKIRRFKVYSSQLFVERKLNTDLPDIERKYAVTEFTIEVCVSDNNILPQLEKGILFYLQNNIFVKERGISLKKEFADEINKMDNEINSLDTIQKVLKNLQVSGDASKITSLNVNTEGIADLHKIKLETQDRLFLADARIVDSFVPFEKPYYPKPFFTIVSWLFIYIILAMIIIFLAELNLKLKEKELQNK